MKYVIMIFFKQIGDISLGINKIKDVYLTSQILKSIIIIYSINYQ